MEHWVGGMVRTGPPEINPTHAFLLIRHQAPYPRQKMTMTTGLWDSAAGEDGVVVWRPI